MSTELASINQPVKGQKVLPTDSIPVSDKSIAPGLMDVSTLVKEDPMKDPSKNEQPVPSEDAQDAERMDRIVTPSLKSFSASNREKFFSLPTIPFNEQVVRIILEACHIPKIR